MRERTAGSAMPGTPTMRSDTGHTSQGYCPSHLILCQQHAYMSINRRVKSRKQIHSRLIVDCVGQVAIADLARYILVRFRAKMQLKRLLHLHFLAVTAIIRPTGQLIQ